MRSLSIVRPFYSFLHVDRNQSSATKTKCLICTVHYDATTKSGRTLPLIATARGSILSLVAPQLRFTVKGTKAAFTKSGVDGQEDSLKLDAKAPSKPRFGVEPKDLQGTLYELDKPGQSTKQALIQFLFFLSKCPNTEPRFGGTESSLR
jgi:hypothetical protein